MERLEWDLALIALYSFFTFEVPMDKGLAFWVVYLIVVLFSAWSNWPEPGGRWQSFGGNLASLILIGLLGWAVFGAPVH